MTTERSLDFQVYDDFDKPDYSLNDYDPRARPGSSVRSPRR